ncbi:DUF5642 family protein [Mycobacterium sp. PSTR-4-N]|uniref:DUF5642 family protein n=1 Tax=Mycobacterium sp. PSTR-4-N TaxID=2917745 RepID=UPI001F14B6D9|nr:DUF5642 family protein [Mycobacterium sp. PSTR-4-N]MCG7593020.1 DUF5642 family protein [Mycobacterium sp. PSTR-4-N]
MSIAVAGPAAWYQQSVRLASGMLAVAMAAGLAACGSGPAPVAVTPSPAKPAAPINPARVERSRSALPAGYEITTYQGPPAPVALWGMRVPAVTEPPQCAVLAAPAADPSTSRGWSGSGPGGIAYAVIAAVPGDGHALPRDCGRWTVSAGPTTATVVGVPAPTIAGADVVGMRTDAVTVVEGGTETRLHAQTFIASLDRYVCLVSLVTDPGSPQTPLGPDFAARLLTETVSALRG